MNDVNIPPESEAPGDWSPTDFIPPRTRTWLYGVVMASAPILALTGKLTESEIPLWLGLVSALLGGGLATAYRPTRSN